MQKVLQFLERHCQWFAIGLGVLFLAYMVYLYTPISPTPALVVKINGRQVLPGGIETTIGVKASDLEHEMSEKHPDFKIPAPPVLTAWQEHITLAEVDVKSLPNPFYYAGTPMNLGPLSNPSQIAGDKVKVLPAPPAATPAVPTAVDEVRTVANVIPPQPAGQAAGANPPAGVPTDVDVVSVLFTIDHTQLAAAFSNAFGNLPNLPPNIQQQINETMVLSVDLIRQEQQPDGSWGPDVVIAPLPIHNILALPAQQNPTPDAVNLFLPWAEAHTADILEPSYYDTEKGMPVIYSPDQPPPPTAAPPQQPTAPTPFSPPGSPFAPGYPRPGTNRPGSNQRGNTGRGRGGVGMAGPGEGAPVYPAQFNGGQPGMPPPGMPGNPWGAPQGQPNQGLNANQINGKFDVTKLGADIRILGHDDTVVPGRTYRYKVRYTLYNSIYGIGNFAKPASLAQQFYLVSPVSNPTAPITIPTRLRFFLASIFRNQVVFDVFTWKNGHWNQTRSQPMSPGDAIPGTDWSVLDVRDNIHSNGDKYALLLNIDGTTERHEVKTDSESADFEQLQAEVKASASANLGTQTPGS